MSFQFAEVDWNVESWKQPCCLTSSWARIGEVRTALAQEVLPQQQRAEKVGRHLLD